MTVKEIKDILETLEENCIVVWDHKDFGYLEVRGIGHPFSPISYPGNLSYTNCKDEVITTKAINIVQVFLY